MATNLVQLAQPVADNNIMNDIQNAFNGRERLQVLLIRLADQRKSLGEVFLKTFAADLAAVKGEPDKGFVDAQFSKFNVWKTADDELSKRIEALRTIAEGLENQIAAYKKQYKNEFINLLTQQIEALREQWQKQEIEEDHLSDRIDALERELADITYATSAGKSAPSAKKVKSK
jgi:gas vesicle protein